MSLLQRVWNLLRQRRLREDLRQEVEAHLALLEDEGRSRGLSAIQARHTARTRFGSPLMYRERALDAVTSPWLADVWKDVAVAVRRLRRTPAFSVTVIVTLALAIGANTAIFALVERVILNPLPYPRSDDLIELGHGAHRLNVPTGFGITPGLYYHYAERARTLEGVGLYRSADMTLAGDQEPERIHVTQASPSLASVLRVSPVLGRWFGEQDALPAAPQTIVLSHQLWMRRYGGNRGVVGELVILEGAPAAIIGVMPRLFAFPDPRVEAWSALQISRSMGFGLWNYSGVARVRPHASVADVRTELNGLIGDIPRAFPGDLLARANGEEIQLFAAPRRLKDATIGNVALGLWILMGSVAIVLIVACANVANLFLVRAEARRRELDLRRALGAGRAGLARYFLAESLLLSAAGGLLGLVLAANVARLLVRFGPATLPRLQEVRVDGFSILFALSLSMLVTLWLGAFPLWRSVSSKGPLHGGGRGVTTGREHHHARRLLMGAQVALALVLLVASGLLVRSFQEVRALDPGFNPSSALTFSIGLPAGAYPTRQAAVAAHHAILDRMSAVPGVSAVSASTCLPLIGGCYGNGLRVAGRALPAGAIPPMAMFRGVAGGYFEALGLHVLRGRGIERRDVDRRDRVAVVNQALVDRFFPQQEPLGQHVMPNSPPPRPGEPALPWFTIVGIVSNTPSRAPGEPFAAPQLFVPMSLAGGPEIPVTALVGPDISVMSYVVRTAHTPLSLLSDVRRAVDVIDPGLALAQVTTLQDMLDKASAQMAFTMVLLVIAAVVAVALGLVGIYGVMSYIVGERKNEIGIRLALGSTSTAVIRMIVAHGASVACGGIAFGLAAAAAVNQFIGSLLYGVGTRDPTVFSICGLGLLSVAVLACWLPARRVTKIDPLVALRSE